MALTGGEALAAQLVEEGVRHVFGVPGVQLDHAMDGLAGVSDRIMFLNTRHEQAAAYMADGYARASGEIGVCSVVPGPGLLNAAAALATAYACNSRVLCVCGQIPSRTIGRGLGMLHEVRNQSGILGSFTKWHGRAADPAEVPALVREAFRQLRSGRPQPVAIEIPPDVLAASAPVELVHPPAVDGETVLPDAQALADAASALRSAQRPVLYAGGGVLAAGAGEELRALAELLDAPVVMSPNGRGAISDRHPLALTTLAGRKVLPEADLVLAVGTRFITIGGQPVRLTAATKTVLVNVDRADLGPPRSADVAVHSDARSALGGLTRLLAGYQPSPSSGTRLDDARAWADEQVAAVEPQHAYLAALRSAIPDDGVLVNELTQVGYLARVGFPVYTPRTFIGPGYQGTLGYGFPTALGAKVADPARPVVAISGDGGFSWNLQELSTMRKFGIAAVVVIFNDGAFGNVRRTQAEEFDARYIGTDLANPDYLTLAESFGIAGVRAKSPDDLQAALASAIADDQPALIEVPVDEMPSAWHLIR